ncbi:MAG TPA: O-antigen ligase family protein [Acidobacteriaceae bacterium]
MEMRSAVRGLALEDVASVLILVFFGMAGAIPGIAPNQASEMTGTPASGLMFAAGIGSQLLVNALILMLALRHGPLLARHLGRVQWAGALAVFALLSAGWSQDPVLSARRAVPFALAGLFGMYLAVRHPLRRQLALFEGAFLILAAGSAVLALALPSLGLDASTGHGGNWQGVFTQKNACGRAMVFATAVVLAQGRLNLRRAGSLAVFVVVLVMSGSRGAWVIEAVLLTMLGVYAVLRRFACRSRRLLAIAAIGGALAAAVAARIYFPVLAGLLGRDPSLTGRTAIWAQVWVAILRRPLLGYGFSAFWRGAKGASFDVVVALRFVLFHAHNGFLEILLELGAAGLLLFVLSYLRAGWRLWPQLFASGREFAACAWPLGLLMLVAAYDFDENTLLSFNGLFWVLYVHALVTVEVGAESGRVAEQAQGLGPGWSHGWGAPDPLLAEANGRSVPWL